MKMILRLWLIAMSISMLAVISGCGNDNVPENLRFRLEWEDHFDAIDSSRWKKATHTWNSNLVQFVQENVTFQNGTMRLHLKNQKSEKKDYTGAEYRTNEKYLYGRFVVRAKFPTGSGIVSSFFTFRDPPDPEWQEIDVEVLGKDTSSVQFTHHWGIPPQSTYNAETFKLDFTTDSDFHEYAFEWIPGRITWFVDGEAMYTATDVNVPHLAQEIMMNIWINNNPDWAGDLDVSALPTYAEYDYVKYYRLDR
jgi:beta-glucanase (GH16 family)